MSRGDIAAVAASYVVGHVHPRTMTPIRVCQLIAALSIGVGAARAQTAGGISIIPRPDSLVVRTGWFKLTPRSVIWADRSDSAVAVRFARSIAPALGFQPRVAIGSSTA